MHPKAENGSFSCRVKYHDARCSKFKHFSGGDCNNSPPVTNTLLTSANYANSASFFPCNNSSNGAASSSGNHLAVGGMGPNVAQLQPNSSNCGSPKPPSATVVELQPLDGGGRGGRDAGEGSDKTSMV